MIVLVTDPDDLYRQFAAGLRRAYGSPGTGIPRLLRPRRRHGTVYGFTVIDPGGNWLRISRKGDEDAGGHGSTGLVRATEQAARLGDAKGDTDLAIAVLDRGLHRYGDAAAVERVAALLYRAELAVRVGDDGAARDALARARTIPLSDEERRRLAGDVAHTTELVDGVVGPTQPGSGTTDSEGS